MIRHRAMGATRSFRDRLLELALEHEQLLDRCDDLASEGDELRSKLKSAPDESLAADNRELKSKVKSLSEEVAELEELRGKITKLTEGNAQGDLLKAECRELQAKLDESKANYIKLDDEVKDIDDENQELRKKLEREVARCNTLEKDLGNLEKDKLDLEAQVDSLKSEKGRASGILAVREDSIAPLPECSALMLPESLTALQDPVESILSADKPLTTSSVRGGSARQGDAGHDGKPPLPSRAPENKVGESFAYGEDSSTNRSDQRFAPSYEKAGGSTLALSKDVDTKQAGGPLRKETEPNRDKAPRGRSERSRRCDGPDGGSAYSDSYSYSRGGGSCDGSRQRSVSRRRRASRREERPKRRRERSGHRGGRRRRRRRAHGHRGRRGGRSRSGGSGSEAGRGRSDSRSRSRSGGGRAVPPPRRGGGKGNYGSGDHRADLEGFISKNQLEARVAHALRSMAESDQKRVMGTDGGENSYMLLDRVKSPNGVVMSRIRKIEGGR